MKHLKPYLNILGRILALASLWIMGGYTAGTALEMIGFDSYPLSTICAAINLIVGMLLLKTMLRYQFIDDAFFKGAEADQAGYIIVRGLWLLPIVGVIIGGSMWLWAIILRFIFRGD